MREPRAGGARWIRTTAQRPGNRRSRWRNSWTGGPCLSIHHGKWRTFLADSRQWRRAARGTQGALDDVRPLASGDAAVLIRSVNLTVDSVHAFPNVPAGTSDAEIIAMTANGRGRFERIDRALSKGTVRNLPRGESRFTVVTFEATGTHGIQRIPVTIPRPGRRGARMPRRLTGTGWWRRAARGEPRRQPRGVGVGGGRPDAGSL